MWCKMIALVISSGLLFSSINCAVSNDDSMQRNSVGRGFDAKEMLSSIATSLMSRGFAPTGGGSQVVSLNVTNLLVLVLLKALIFAAGSLGAGAWKGGYARSVDGQEKLLTDEEMLMYLSYLTGEPGNNGCLQNIACKQPEQALKYVAAGDVLLKASKMLSLDPDRSYQYVLGEIEQAAKEGVAQQNCSKYVCEMASSPAALKPT